MIEELTIRVRELVAEKEAVGFDVKFDLGNAGIIFVAGAESPMQVSNENSTAETTFRVASGDMQAMLNGELAPMMAYMQGKLVVDGDIGQALKLSSFF